MALSASESALLASTCQNMNIAASTCREVLEMLRSIGNTGVVDIATHDNDPDAHENCATIARIDPSTNTFAIGTPDDTYFAAAPFIVGPPAGGSKAQGPTISLCRSKMGGDVYHATTRYLAETDSNGDLQAAPEVSVYLSYDRYYYVSLVNNSAKTTSYVGISVQRGSDDGGAVAFSLKASDGDSATLTHYFTKTAIHPATASGVSLGMSSRPYSTAYLGTAATVTSDRRAKADIAELGSSAVDFVMALKPSSYTIKEDVQRGTAFDEKGQATELETLSGTRTHWGFVAQDVKNAMTATGIEDAAVWCLADKDDPDSRQALRYEELIAPLVKAVQVLAAKVEALEGK